MNKYRKPEAQPASGPSAPAEDRWGLQAEDGTREWTDQHRASGLMPLAAHEYVDAVLAHGQKEICLAGHVEWSASDSPRAVLRWRASRPLEWWGAEQWLRK